MAGLRPEEVNDEEGTRRGVADGGEAAGVGVGVGGSEGEGEGEVGVVGVVAVATERGAGARSGRGNPSADQEHHSTLTGLAHSATRKSKEG